MAEDIDAKSDISIRDFIIKEGLEEKYSDPLVAYYVSNSLLFWYGADADNISTNLAFSDPLLVAEFVTPPDIIISGYSSLWKM